MCGEGSEEAAVGRSHSAYRLVYVQTRGVHSAELELVHYVVIDFLRVEVRCIVGVERSDAVCQSLLDKVFAKVHVVVCRNSQGYIERTSPVGIGKHLEEHEVTFIKCTLA